MIEPLTFPPAVPPGINQNFLRRGTRADLERIHIERLIGKRAPDDWLLAGSLEWLKRRDKLDLEAAQLRERLRMVDECAKWSAIPEWTEDFDCEHYCGLKFPCASCVDQILNGDEELEDCGGSCDPCPTCFDGVLNGDETGVDCGGEVCSVCVSANRSPLSPLSPAPGRILYKEKARLRRRRRLGTRSWNRGTTRATGPTRTLTPRSGRRDATRRTGATARSSTSSRPCPERTPRTLCTRRPATRRTRSSTPGCAAPSTTTRATGA